MKTRDAMDYVERRMTSMGYECVMAQEAVLWNDASVPSVYVRVTYYAPDEGAMCEASWHVWTQSNGTFYGEW